MHNTHHTHNTYNTPNLHDAHTQGRVPRLLAAALLAGLAFGAALADNTRANADAEARYQREMAACNSGQSQQDMATCKREAANALAAARQGQLTATPADPVANAAQRCTVLPMDQREDCVARITRGDATGSVGGGGILREHTTIVPVPAPAR